MNNYLFAVNDSELQDVSTYLWFPLELRHTYPLDIIQHRMKCHKVILDLPSYVHCYCHYYYYHEQYLTRCDFTP